MSMDKQIQISQIARRIKSLENTPLGSSFSSNTLQREGFIEAPINSYKLQQKLSEKFFDSRKTTKLRSFLNKDNSPQRNQKDIRQSVRDISESNRLKSKEKIKNEELFFRYRLKMMSILQLIQTNDKELIPLKDQDAETFLGSFNSKILEFIKRNQKKLAEIQTRAQALVKYNTQVKEKNEWLSKSMRELEKELDISKQNYQIQGREIRKLLIQKEEELNRLKIKLIQFSSRKTQRNSIIDIVYKNVAIQTRDESSSQKMKKEWKEKMTETIEYYEEMMKRYERSCEEKDAEITSLKSIARKYFNSRLSI